MIIIFLIIYKAFVTVLLLELLLLLTLMCFKRVVVDPNTIFLTTGFSQKMPKAQILCIPLIHAIKYMIQFYLM